jgi:hypothetical protein
LPIGCLVEKVVFHDGVWGRALELFGERDLESSKLYEFVRDAALRGEYEEIFSSDALALLRAAESRVGLTVEDVYAPLVTMTLADVSENSGRRALQEFLPPRLAKSICGVPRKDMTSFEANIRESLYRAGLDRNVHVLMSNDFGKTLRYTVSHNGARPVREVIYTDCQPSMMQVIVAARAIGKDGEPQDLSRAKQVVHALLRRSGYLKHPEVLDKLNPRVFCEPVNESVFSPKSLKAMKAVVPVWIQKGGCGVINEG